MKFVTVLFLTVLCSFSALTNAKAPSIKWYEMHLAPYAITTGANKGKGVAQLAQKLLIEEMPEFRHTIQTGNFKRIYTDLARFDNVCNMTVLSRPGIEQALHLSVPWIYGAPIGISLRKEDVKKFERFIDGDTVDLEALITQSSFRLGAAKERPYGVALDPLIARYASRKNVRIIGGASRQEDMFNILLKRKVIDGVIGYPPETQYYLMTNGIKSQPMRYFFIKQQPEKPIGHVGCSKTPLGKQIIEAINPILLKHRRGVLRDEFLKYLDPTSRKFHDSIANPPF